MVDSPGLELYRSTAYYIRFNGRVKEGDGKGVAIFEMLLTGGGYYPPKIKSIIIFADNVRSPEAYSAFKK